MFENAGVKWHLAGKCWRNNDLRGAGGSLAMSKSALPGGSLVIAPFDWFAWAKSVGQASKEKALYAR